MGPIGGDERDRTADPLLAKQVLSQLSYTPGVASAVTALRFRLKPKTAFRYYGAPFSMPTHFVGLVIDLD